MKLPPMLNSNDVALAAGGCAHAIHFWKKRGRTKYCRERIAELQALIAKLDAASRHLCPYEGADHMPLDWGSDPIYGPLTKRQQRAAIRGSAVRQTTADGMGSSVRVRAMEGRSRHPRARVERSRTQGPRPLCHAGQGEGMSEWMPIETAPRDRFILLWCPEDQSRWLARWQGGAWYGVDDLGLRRTSRRDDGLAIYEFTAWQDIPAPPSPGKEG